LAGKSSSVDCTAAPGFIEGAGCRTCPADDQKTKHRADLHGHYGNLGDFEMGQERAGEIR
jgi:hypothetical protein